MPSWSGAGNIRPVSTTTMRPSYSTTIMFLPISPRPPSGRTFRVLVIGQAAGRARRAALLSPHRGGRVAPLERLADAAALLLGAPAEGQPQRAGLEADHVH